MNSRSHRSLTLSLMSKIIEKIDELRSSLRHAFAIDDQEKGGERGLTDDELALVRKLADIIIRRKMGVPAALFLESFQPLNFIGSHIMERRSSIEILIQEIRSAEEDSYGRN